MRLIDADALIHEINECLWDWDSVDGITATTVLKQTISDIENMPTIESERQALDEIYGMMKDYYFKHRNDHDDSWQGGFAKCMNLIPNVYERREDG